MADGATDDQLRCSYCGTEIVQYETLVQTPTGIYCCPNCDQASQRGDLARRARRGGGYVLTCNYCGTPIYVREIMITVGPRSYCCRNCATVAQARRASAMPTSRA